MEFAFPLTERKSLSDMNKKTILTVAIACLCALSAIAQKCAVNYMPTADFKNKVWDMKGTRWNYRGSSAIVIDCYTTWCGPCKRLAPIMEELAADYCGRVQFYKLDIEREPEIAAKFQIHSIPTLLFIPASGTPGMLQGLRSKEELKSVIDKHLLGK